MTSKTLAMIFVVSLSIGGFFLYKSQTNTIFSNLNKAEVKTLLNERKDKDDIAMNRFKKNIEKLFEEQEKGTVKRKPICLQGAMKNAYRKGKESVNSAISKVQNLFSDEEKVEKKESILEDIELEEVNRLDGFIDEITSVCYQGEIIYLTGKEKAGTITDKDISKFTNEIWNKYFYSSDTLEEEIEKSINLFIAEVENNHKDIYKIINNYDYNFDKSYSTDKEKAMLSLNEFIKKQSGYSIGTTVSAFITGYSASFSTNQSHRHFHSKENRQYSPLCNKSN
jgi:hemerythrin